ncbi:uncharacterized protein EAF02_003299 [Botrytis sinoallii]|uniref:uncharacterized protein n=1 Tax=Botrytis sinoallii TaxID=1463999 RepID=UPI001901908A|nr:uncharacterized protein EAF02_003299 [Botrytis sinoallii]KAF7886652.1 hypothetical protein EAF02_003299 [Botrytis sinoallii]
MDNLPSYELTPGMPVLSSRQKRMLKAYEVAHCIGLVDEMYRMAEEDLLTEKFPVRQSMTLMLEDSDGEMEMLKLLYTIHERVLVAIIKGTIGHELVSTRGKENDLRKCLLPINAQAGTYLITFLKKDSDKYLSISQLVKVTQHLKNYLSFHENPLGDDPTPERLLQYEDAVKIEALLCPGYELSHIQDSVKAACLEHAGIEFDRIEMAILKVWEQSQFRLGEALVTMLAGSLVWEGGLNAVQAGGQPLDMGDVRSLDVCEELFFKTDWTIPNFEKCREMFETYQRRVQRVADFDPTERLGELREMVKGVGEDIENLDRDLDQISEMTKEKIKMGEAVLKQLDEDKVEMQRQIDGYNLEIEFAKMYLEWVRDVNSGNA